MTEPSLLERLKGADQLPTAPGVALRIVELNRHEDVDISAPRTFRPTGCD